MNVTLGDLSLWSVLAGNALALLLGYTGLKLLHYYADKKMLEEAQRLSEYRRDLSLKTMGSTRRRMSDSEFKAEVFDSPLPVLVYVSTARCASSRIFSRVIDDLERDFEGWLRVVRIEFEHVPLPLSKTLSKMNIQSVPVLIAYSPYNRGVVLGIIPGVLSRSQLKIHPVFKALWE